MKYKKVQLVIYFYHYMYLSFFSYFFPYKVYFHFRGIYLLFSSTCVKTFTIIETYGSDVRTEKYNTKRTLFLKNNRC